MEDEHTIKRDLSEQEKQVKNVVPITNGKPIKKVFLTSFGKILHMLKSENLGFFKKHVSFVHTKWCLKNILGCKKTQEKKHFLPEKFFLFWRRLFQRPQKNTLEDERERVLVEKKEKEEHISTILQKIEKLENHIDILSQREQNVQMELDALAKNENLAEDSREKQKTEKARWRSYKTLHLIEGDRFDVFDVLNRANNKLRLLRTELLDMEAMEASIEQEIEKQTILKAQKGHKPASEKTSESKTPEVKISKAFHFSSILSKFFGRRPGVHFHDLFLLSVRTFRTKFAMTMMTILGIGVSFATIFFLVSLGYGLEKLLLDQFASPILMRSLDVATLSPEAIPLNEEARGRIAMLSGIEHTEPIFGISGQLEFDTVSSEVEFRGASPKYFELSGKALDSGRIYEGDEHSIILSSSFLQTTGKATLEDFDKPVSVVVYRPFVEEGAEGTEIVKLGTDFKVVGIYKDPDNSFAYLSPNFIDKMIPQYSSLKVVARDTKDIPLLREQISDMGFVTSSVLDTVDQATKVFGVLEILLTLFGAASLLVATIGMVNTMTVSLLQRTQEIGVMKVLGVSDKDVRKLFLLEAAIIGGLGGLSGIIMGFIFSQAFNFGLNFLARNLGGQTVSLFYYPLWFVVSVVSASFVIGVLTGVVPAQRAAKMDPINAVKYK